MKKEGKLSQIFGARAQQVKNTAISAAACGAGAGIASMVFLGPLGVIVAPVATVAGGVAGGVAAFKNNKPKK